ncbi:MAG: PDZ domain-containing protein, partial [Clostridia bacterium]|nr:PDZ domain-containing protein [Clostridia bacterium]
EKREEIYLGGTPIGIQAVSPYFVVTEFVNVVTSEGSFSPAQKAGLKKGDIILSVNGERPKDIAQLCKTVETTNTAEFIVKRNNEVIKIAVNPAKDIRQNAKKVGIMVKNDLSGIGTLTYVRKDKRFGALGHPIADQYGYSDVYQTGTVYDCTVLGYNRAKNDKPGELIGKIESKKPIGTFDSNTLSGILGKLYELPEGKTAVTIATKEEVKPGKATIYTTIDGKRPDFYDIEIIKANFQPEEKEKSMIIRVTDKYLLSKTGGILQGMSGSPIVQDGNLVGAVTHVLTADSTMGYGIYIEWMMN